MKSTQALAKLARAGLNGRNWYHDANAEITTAALELNITPKYLADLLALFSPRISVLRSIRHSIRYATAGEFNSDVMQGVRASVAHYEATGEIRGTKTEPFSRALLDDPEAVVLDVWMSRAMEVEQARFKNKKTYAEMSLLVCKAAEQVKLTPAETQAAIWFATMRNAGRYPQGLRLLEELHRPQTQ